MISVMQYDTWSIMVSKPGKKIQLNRDISSVFLTFQYSVRKLEYAEKINSCLLTDITHCERFYW